MKPTFASFKNVHPSRPTQKRPSDIQCKPQPKTFQELKNCSATSKVFAASIKGQRTF